MRHALVALSTVLLTGGVVLACTLESGRAGPPATVQESRPTRPAFDHEHARWTSVLRAHVHGDRFDYAAVKADPAELDAYLVGLQSVTRAQLESWTEDQRMAFWINVYNASAVKLVASEYPIDSIRDLGTLLNKVWDKRFIDLPQLDPEGRDRKLSLDDVEHAILRPRFEDARVHAAVNCASESCPPLRAEAFVAARLDAQLDEQVRAWLADEARNRFDVAERAMRISEIFRWFREDFERDGGSVQGWIAKYAPEDVAPALNAGAFEVGYLDYSWKLNAWVEER